MQNSNRGDNTSYTRKYQKHISCSFAYKAVCVDDKLSESVVLYRRKNSVNKFIEKIIKQYNYCKDVMRKYFNKNLVMSAKDEERFQ